VAHAEAEQAQQALEESRTGADKGSHASDKEKAANSTDDEDDSTCTICYAREIGAVFVPCGVTGALLVNITRELTLFVFFFVF
jgi:hypothetical protein